VIITKSNKSNKYLETLQFKRKAMAVIQLVNKDNYLSIATSYDNIIITVPKPIKCNEREMKYKLKLTN
jgi:hypothetical protein